MEWRKTFPFNREWNKRLYATKEVRPISWKKRMKSWL
jgi:hypothetical protein